MLGQQQVPLTEAGKAWVGTGEISPAVGDYGTVIDLILPLTRAGITWSTVYIDGYLVTNSGISRISLEIKRGLPPTRKRQQKKAKALELHGYR